jgi:hypothetical protein
LGEGKITLTICKRNHFYKICEGNSQMGLFKIKRQMKVKASNREEWKKLLKMARACRGLQIR